jgi:hypothetical protein
MSAANPTRPYSLRRSPTMHPQKRSLLWLNALGGAAVLGSYVWGLAQPEVAGGLWGGVPESLRPLYTANMFLAAAGYFLFAPYIFFRIAPDATRIAGRYGFGTFHLLFALVLVPSALWLPLTAWMLASPSAVLWWAIRLDLALVGLGSLGLAWALLALGPERPRGRVLALIGLVPFCLQTAVLDALVWPLFFPVS